MFFFFFLISPRDDYQLGTVSYASRWLNAHGLLSLTLSTRTVSFIHGCLHTRLTSTPKNFLWGFWGGDRNFRRHVEHLKGYIHANVIYVLVCM